MFNRTIRMLESGVKPVYVFDGKPPTMKSGEVRRAFVAEFGQFGFFLSVPARSLTPVLLRAAARTSSAGKAQGSQGKGSVGYGGGEGVWCV